MTIQRNVKRVIRIGAVILVFVMLGTWIIAPRKVYPDREKTVICVESVLDLNQDYIGEKDITLDDCREYLVDYSEEKHTILYLNLDEQIVERSVETGNVDKMDLLELGIYPSEGQEIHNLQYGPEEQEISFVFNNCIYIWNTETRELCKVVDSCIASIKYNTYQWCDTGDLYFLQYHRNRAPELYFLEKGKMNPEFVRANIVSFILNDNEDVLYAVEEYDNYDGIMMNIKFQIIKINIEDGTMQEIGGLDSNNFILKESDDRYLYYLEESSYKKNAKMYCIDLKSRQKNCVYRTNRKIVGITF